MTIRLPEKWTRFFLRQPESGMGYQRVDVRLTNNREKGRGCFQRRGNRIARRLRTKRDRRYQAAPLSRQPSSGFSALIAGQRGGKHGSQSRGYSGNL
jgi:hypothetical protein